MSDDPIVKALRKVLDQQAEPRVVVLVAHGLVELMVNALVDSRCKHGKKIKKDKRGFPHATKLIILNEIGFLPDPFYEVLDRFRDLRNDAAHEPFFEVDEVRIKRIAEPFENNLPDGFTLFSDLGSLCASILQSLWNQYQGILGPIFVPSVHQAMKDNNHKSDAP